MAPHPSDRRGGDGSSRSLLRLFSDERLARRAAKGDRGAFETIWRRHRENLYRFCLAMTGDAADAREALWRIEAKALRTLSATAGRIEPKPWLYRLARAETGEAGGRRDAAASEGRRAETAEARARVHRLLDDLGKLPRRQRAVLVMRELSGLGYTEIGAAFDTSGAAARRLAREARRALDEIARNRGGQAAFAPLPIAAALGLLPGASGGSGLAGALGLGAGAAAGTSAAAKLTATAALVAVAVSVPTAERSITADPAPEAENGPRALVNPTGEPGNGDTTGSGGSIAVVRSTAPVAMLPTPAARPGPALGASKVRAAPTPRPAGANPERNEAAHGAPHPVATPVSVLRPAGPAESSPDPAEAELSSAGEGDGNDNHPAQPNEPGEGAAAEHPAETVTSTAPETTPPDDDWQHGWPGGHKKHREKKGRHSRDDDGPRDRGHRRGHDANDDY